MMEKQYMPQWPFTEAALIDEVRDMLAAIITGAEASVFGAGTLQSLIGMDGSDDGLWRDNLDLRYRSVPDAMNLLYRVRQVLDGKVDAAKIDVHRYPATFAMRALYDYVIHAHWPEGVHLEDILTQAITFTEMAGAADEVTGDFGAPHRCRAVIERAKARGRLDCLENGWMQTIWTEEGAIGFSDLAYLANIDERTVRNATLRDDDRRLHTVNEDGKRVVEPQEARRWLDFQPGFRKTEFYVLSERQAFEKTAAPEDRFVQWHFRERPKADVVDLQLVSKRPSTEDASSEEITLSDNNLRSHSLRLSTIMDRFPRDVVGGSNRDEQAPKTLTVEFPDQSMCLTDIDGRKKILRERSAIRRFYAAHGLKAGDRVRVTWLGERRIRLDPADAK